MQKITSTLLGIAMATALVMPSGAIAAPAAQADNFCTRLSSRDADLDRALAQREDAMEQRQTNQLARITRERANKDRQIALNRVEADRDFAQRIEQLEARAKTPAQRTAVNTFKNAINAATNTRRSAVDAAFTTYRAGVDSAIAGRQSAMRSALATLTTSIDTAVSMARASCTAGTRPETVRQSFQNDLARTRTAYATAKSNLPNIDARIETLRTARMNAVEAARTAFQTAAASARTALNNAFR